MTDRNPSSSTASPNHRAEIEQLFVQMSTLASELQPNATRRIAQDSALVILEFLGYCLCAGFALLTIAMNVVYPFNLLARFPIDQDVRNGIHFSHEEWFHLAVRTLGLLVCILFLRLARTTTGKRRRRRRLYALGGALKQHISRLRQLSALDDLSPDQTFNSQNLREIPNPGYDPSR